MADIGVHIAHVLPWPTVGGTELATLRIAQVVNGPGFRHTAFCPGQNSPVQELFAQAGFDTVHYEAAEPSYRHPRGFISASFKLAKEFRRHKIDLVHCSDLLGAYYAAVAGKLARLPVLSHIRCSYPNLSRRDQSFLRAVNRFVFVSNDAWRTFSYHVSNERGLVIRDGIKLDLDQANKRDAEDVRREFNLPADVQVVGMVARVAPAKDYPTLARAAARVLAQEKNVRFLIVGDHSQVPLNRAHYEEVKVTLEKCGVAPYFIFTDHRADVARLTSAMDIFVLSTHTEGLPLVILEAMAQGKPVVATEVGGVPELVKHAETGFLHGEGDDELLATQLLTLLKDSGLKKRLGEAGRRRVETEFTLDRFAGEMTTLYRDMLRRTAWTGALSASSHASAVKQEKREISR